MTREAYAAICLTAGFIAILGATAIVCAMQPKYAQPQGR